MMEGMSSFSDTSRADFADESLLFTHQSPNGSVNPNDPMGEDELRSYDLIKFRLDFAHRSFMNHQEMVRFLDQKTGLLLSAVGLLTTAQGAFILRAFTVPATTEWQIWMRVVVGVCMVVYMFVAFAIISAGVNVFAPSVKPLRPDTTAPGFLFPLRVLAKHEGKEELYLERLTQAKPTTLMHDLANQMVEIASVYQNKYHNLQRMLQRFRWLSMIWVLNMLLLAITAVIS